MNGRRKTNQLIPDFRELTEACPRKQTRLKTSIVPELCAWLTMHAGRHAAAVEGIERAMNPESQSELDPVLTYHKNAIKCINALIGMTPDRFSRDNWLDAVHITQVSFGLPTDPYYTGCGHGVG